MKEKMKDVLSRDNKKVVYFLAILPILFMFLYYILWSIIFTPFVIILIPFFLYSIFHIGILNSWLKSPLAKEFVRFIQAYFIVWYISLFLLIFTWNWSETIFPFILLFIISCWIYIDRIYLLYYFTYRKVIHSLIIPKIVVWLNYLYNAIIRVSLPVLIFLFSIYLYENIWYFNVSNLYIDSFIIYLSDNFYSKFETFFFIKLLYLLIFIIILIFTLRYIKNILWFLSKVIFNLSTFFTLLIWIIFYTIIYKYGWDFNKINFTLEIYLNTFVLIFIYFFLYALRNFLLINWQWKNNIYKKLYSKLYWSNLDVSILNVIRDLKEDDMKVINIFFSDMWKYFDMYLWYKKKENNYLKLSTDNPIRLWDKDLLWVWRFTESLFSIIEWYSFDNKKSNWSFSIWVVWEWWIWKSSVINLLKDEYLDWYPWYKVYEFNPWNFEKKDLIERFFIDLDFLIWNKKISRLFKKYLISLWEFHKWFKSIQHIFIDKALNDIKNELNSELIKLKNTKIIVIIDDLDRCDQNEILMMLNIIKNLWNLNNIIYIASYDKDNIINILNKKWYEANYLDKIINFERFLPINNPQILNDFFFNWFGKIVDDIFISKNNLLNISNDILNNIDTFTKNTEKLKENINMLTNVTNKIVDSFKNYFWYKEKEKKVFNKDNILKKTGKYERINKDELLFFLQWELSYLFSNVNLRLIKKLLNHLKIIFVTNLYTVRDLDNVFKFKKEDYLNIIIINFIKIIDYKWYIDVLNFRYTKFWWDNKERWVSYDEKDIPEIFQKVYYGDEDKFKVKFLSLLFIIWYEQEHKKDLDNPSINTVYNTWLNIIPKNIDKNLKIILEKFN